ncbi:hypothetical protein [Rhizohabitans arisaemae]|uniref:hypothetical protein n=1 Tax=Rhizohabitans arisaemae TaxID=2720610 RepID=UPI0024B0EAAA|nr:hypothetical protein [Rhizohabitans arisaemae]
MHSGLRVLLALTGATVLALGGATAVSAAPAAATEWKWGPIRSADGLAKAKGKVFVGQNGYAISGTVTDTRGPGCAWLRVRYQSSTNGRWRTVSFYNCVPGSGTFRKELGGVLQVKAQTCRGNSDRSTGSCSRAKTVYTQGS